MPIKSFPPEFNTDRPAPRTQLGPIDALMEMYSGNLGRQPTLGTPPTLAGRGRTAPGGDTSFDPTGGGGKPFVPVYRQGVGFWEWLAKIGMPADMVARIQQDPALQAQYFEQYQASKAAPTQPGPMGSSSSGGGYGGGGGKEEELSFFQNYRKKNRGNWNNL